MLERLAAISDDGEPGVTRLAYTAQEREAHRLFGSWMEELGLTVRTDQAGNTIAERPGTEPARGAIGSGSHLDSVTQGGRYHGTVGVVAAGEVARAMVEADVKHRHSMRFVAFAGEEGARFGQARIGSKLAAGLCTEEHLRTRRDQGPASRTRC